MKFRNLFVALIFTVPFWLYFPYLADFVYPFGSPYNDLTISHLPNLIFFKQSLAQWNSVPLWSPLIYSGYPFMANPLAGLWYPPQWLMLITPQPLGYNLLVLFHLWWGGWGLYHFLKNEGVSTLGAIVGGVSFALLPKLFAHYSAGHVGLVFAVTWTPLLLWATSRDHRKESWSAFSGLILGLIFLTDLRWAPFAALVWVGYSLYSSRVSIRSVLKLNLQPVRQHLLHMVKTVGIATLIGCPMIVPLMEYSSHSTRSHLTAQDNLSFSLEPVRLLGLFVPDIAGYAEWVIYPGIFGFLLLGWVLSVKPLRRKLLFWIVLILVASFIALGSSVLIFQWIYQLPGVNLLRVPARAMFLAGLGFAVLSAYGFDALLEIKEKKRKSTHGKFEFGPGLVLAAVTGFLLVVTTGLYFLTREINIEFLWGTVAALIFSTLILSRDFQFLSQRVWRLIVIPCIVLDLGGISYLQSSAVKYPEITSQSKEIAEFLSGQPGDFRVYTPSNSLSQLTGAIYEIEQANGIDPMQLENYIRYIDQAVGVSRPAYSVTVPFFSTENISTANQDAILDLEMLGRLNVKYIIAEFPIQQPGLRFITQIGSTYLYFNERAYPRAWVESGDRVQPVTQIKRQPNRITITAEGPGELFLSEIQYPGWTIEIDGKPAKNSPGVPLLRAVRLGQGVHEVDWLFRPTSLYLGFGLGILGWALILVKFFTTQK